MEKIREAVFVVLCLTRVYGEKQNPVDSMPVEAVLCGRLRDAGP